MRVRKVDEVVVRVRCWRCEIEERGRREIERLSWRREWREGREEVDRGVEGSLRGEEDLVVGEQNRHDEVQIYY